MADSDYEVNQVALPLTGQKAKEDCEQEAALHSAHQGVPDGQDQPKLVNYGHSHGDW